MSALPINFDPYNPIPNNPFYSPITNYLQGPFGPLVLGSGLSVSAQGVISAAGGGGGGTVTSITAGLGLTGGTITSIGTIGLAPSGAVAGTYTYPALSVDSFGRITSIASSSPVVSVSANAPLILTGAPTAPTISVQPASTTQVGVTQLNNTTSSTLVNQALTAAAGKSLQDQINAVAQSANGLILAGTLNASTGNVVNATTAGNSAGITAGSPVPAATVALNNYYLIVTTAATSYTPTGGVPISNVNVGDYIIVSSGTWTILRVGPITGAYATTTTDGVVRLATSAQVITGTDPNLVVTPFTGSTAYVARNTFTGQGQLLAGTGASTYSALPQGIDGQVLTVDSSCARGIKWAPPAGGGSSGITSISFSAPLNSTSNPLTTGAAAVGIDAASTTTCGAVQLATVSDALAGASTTLAVTPAAGAAAYVAAACYNTKGDIPVGTGPDAYAILPAGANGLALIACSACSSGLTWASALQPSNPSALGASYGITCDAVGNTSVGFQALQAIYQLPGTGVGNTALGRGAGGNLSSGSCNVALGTGALTAEQSGANNTALGTGALCTQNGASNNTAVGFGAGNSITTGSNNTLLGSTAGDNLSTGCFNVLLGQGTGIALTSGGENVFVGDSAGPLITGGVNNVYIGSSAGSANTSGNNVVIVGASGSSSSPTVSNEANIWAGTTVARFAQGATAWSFPSDVRLKENVVDLDLGLDFIDKVQPRAFDWKEGGQHSAGFIAQELDAVVQEFGADYLGAVSKADPDCHTVAQSALIPVLVNAIKELKAELDELKKKIG